jgi:hypothetical protein
VVNMFGLEACLCILINKNFPKSCVLILNNLRRLAVPNKISKKRSNVS